MSLGLLLMAAFGTEGPRVQLAGATLSDFSITPTNAEVGYQLSGAGNEQSYEGTGSPYSTIQSWLILGSAGDYDCRLTVNSGTAPAGSGTGSWLNLATARAWTLTDTTVIGPVISNNCTIEIRDATTLDVLASATVTMEVQEGA